MTQLLRANENTLTDEMNYVAGDEHIESALLLERIRRGLIVIPDNVNHPKKRVFGVGKGLRTKVNANIGTSADYPDIDTEVKKLQAALKAGAHSVMDLSTGGMIRTIRKTLIEKCDVMLGTVPIYEAVVDVTRGKGKNIKDLTAGDLLATIKRHGEDGVDFITVHCGVTKEVLKTLATANRLCGMVSRGGSFLAEWVVLTGQENPLYEHYDELLDIAREYDMTLSLGDGLRPGAIADAMDAPQVHELMIMAELAKRAREKGVQVMLEGPGHVPLDQVEAQIKLQKELCDDAPFYVLGPIVTDVAPGYDHITSAIGGAVAAKAGADFLCYVTPAEHLCLPNPEHVREGVIAARIAAHAGDIAKGIPGAAAWDEELSTLRRKRQWEKMLELSIDPERALDIRMHGKSADESVCSMCGEYCVFKIADEHITVKQLKDLI